jgi:PAS domain S-box-containing protein
LAKPYAFDKTEVEILQDLADDLAYALISIKAREQQAILQTAAETMQDGLLIADLEGNLVYVNSIVAKIAGIPTNEIIGLNIIDLLSKEQALDFKSTLNVLIKRGHLPLTIDYHSPLGRKIVISTHSALVHNEQGQPQHIVINIRDITSQRQYENQLVTLNRLTTDLVQIHDIQVLLENILPITEELLNSSASLIYTVDPDTKHVSDVLAHNLPDDCSQRFVQDGSNLSGTTALATLKPVYIPDTRTDPTYGEGVSFMTDANVRSLLIFPIVFHNSPIGIMAVCHEQPQHYDENHIQLGKTLAQTLAIIIQNARLYEYSRRRVDEMEALVMASTALSTTLDYKKVLQVITEQLTKTLDIQACAISDYDSELNAIKLIVELLPDDWENDKDWNQPYFLDEYPLTKEILENNIPCQLRIDNPELDQAERDFMLDAGINFLLMLPLVTQDQTIGLIELMDEREDRFISDSQMMLIQALASQAAISIQNARLYQAERHQHQLAEALIQAASSLNSTLNLEEVFDEILKQVMQVVDCKAANFMMVADGYGYVRRYRGYDEIPGYLDIIKSIRIPTSTPNLSTMLNGEMNLVSDTYQDPSWIVYPGAEWIKSYIGIPLKIDQEVVGFLNVDSDIPGFFAEDAVRRLLTFADHAAIALKNADLYQQLHEYAAELETRVQTRTAELKAAKEHIEGILSSVPDAVFVLDQDHNLIQSNQAGKLMLEQAKKGNQDLFSPEFLASVKDPKILEMQNLTEVDEFAYQARASDIYLEEGQLAGQVIVFRDVTRFKELDLLKSQFISDVSHELRTPLTNLTLYLGLFENDQVHGKQRTYLDILKRETERLTHLIEDLLTFSRIQLSQIDEKIQPLDINQIVHQLTIDRAFWAAKRDIRLTYRPLNDLPAAMANANGLSQVLSNLLTNAINYTPAGGRVILETDVKARKKQNWVVISVIDNGTGITDDEIPFIFDRFFRGSASHVTGAEGTGLGLAISKELVTRMGGEITFESSLGEGSSFHVWLRPPGSAML